MAEENNGAPVAQTTPVPAATTPVEPAKDRTREQFEKLLDSNQRLFEQNEVLRKEMQASNLAKTTAQKQPEMLDFYQTDPTTGETLLNGEKLNERLKTIQDRAEQAEKQVQSLMKTAEEREIDRQNREAWNVYPELNPETGDKFNKKFHQQVRGVLYDSMMNTDEYGGRALTFKEAADFVRGEPVKIEQQVEAPKGENEAQALKEASAAQNVASHPQLAPALSDDAELRELQIKTRYGSDEALAQRLLHTEHILPRDAQEKQD